MITDALLNLFTSFLNLFISSRPAWSFQTGQSAGQMIVWLYGMDNILPVTETCACVLGSMFLFTTMSATKYGVKLIDWIADIIP